MVVLIYTAAIKGAAIYKGISYPCCCLVAKSCVTLRPHGLQHSRLLCPSLSLRVCSNSCPLSWWCPSNHLILCHPLLLPSLFSSIRVFSHESALCIRFGQSIGASASASVLPMNIQSWFPLGLTGLISLLSKGPQESSLAPQFKNINSLALSLLYCPTLTSIHDYWENHSFDYMDFCQQSDVYAF